MNILATSIRAYRKIPHRPKCRCHPEGPTCSQRGLAAAQARGLMALPLVVGLLLDCSNEDGHASRS